MTLQDFGPCPPFKDKQKEYLEKKVEQKTDFSFSFWMVWMNSSFGNSSSLVIPSVIHL